MFANKCEKIHVQTRFLLLFWVIFGLIDWGCAIRNLVLFRPVINVPTMINHQKIYSPNKVLSPFFARQMFWPLKCAFCCEF